jgi:UDP-3-O-[3-hydroxymyristoyl] N-acetylglucosamine deacetylase
LFLLAIKKIIKIGMSLLTQKTIKNSISFNGVGLHSGKNVNICLKSAPPDTGIVFKRVDLVKNNLVYPNFNNVTNTSLNTTISNEFDVKVSTIEHLMGALFGLGIDNAIIEIDNEEVPILDGSAKEFVDKILKCGFKASNQPIKIIKITKEVKFEENNRVIRIEPSKFSLEINFELKYENKTIGNQKNKINVYENDLVDIFNSRTFCLYEDIEYIKKNGLAKGGSLENAIVVKNDKVLNEGGLRNSKEFVNHKILDCIGDLYTCGYRIIGKIICSQGGHYLTNKLLKEVFSDNSNFQIIEIKERNLPHLILNKSTLRSIA